MSGVYIHIPFCKSRCLYCDFFSTTRLDYRADYVEALLEEWKQRRSEIDGEVTTLYFGGGTPSLLPPEAIQKLIYTICPSPTSQEITLEANPGDLYPDQLLQLRQAGVNRLSIGIQSFNNVLLNRIGRRHTTEEAIQAVHMAQEAGFDNLSIDLIYGLPGQDMKMWQQEIDTALSLRVPHISAYCLSYEEGTPLSRMLARGEVPETDEDTEIQMYDYLVLRLQQAGYEHYEVSNFALPDKYSRHNSSYWNNTPYIGLGAGAHSYDGKHRSWNIDDLDKYINGIRQHTPVREAEELTPTDCYNERIMLGLRTANGIDYRLLHHPEAADTYIRQGLLQVVTLGKQERLVATLPGIHILNRIIEDLIE